MNEDQQITQSTLNFELRTCGYQFQLQDLFWFDKFG